MGITDKPPVQQYTRGLYEVTDTPVAFRVSSRAVWRSYEPGNPRYAPDYAKHNYAVRQTPDRRSDVLCISESKFVGIEYETNCSACGGYTILHFPADWTPRPVSARCGVCGL